MAIEYPQKRYLGDGVYASCDGYQIILETSNGIDITNRIALDNQVLHALDQYRSYRNQHWQEWKERQSI